MADKPKIALDSTAWQAGFDAGKSSRRTACPYPAYSTESLSWSSGFIEGEAARLAPTLHKTQI